MNKTFISKILDKLEDKADLIGGIAGLVADPIGNGRGISGAVPFMFGRLSQWKVPDLGWIMQNFWFNESRQDTYPVMTGLMAAAGGWVLSEVGGVVDSRLSKIGRVVKKAGIATSMGAAIGSLLWLPAIYDPVAQTTSNAGVGGVYS